MPGNRSGAFIEPLDEPFAALQRRCAGRSGYVTFQILCGAINGEEVDFHLAEAEMGKESWGDAKFVRRTGRRWGR